MHNKMKASMGVELHETLSGIENMTISGAQDASGRAIEYVPSPGLYVQHIQRKHSKGSSGAFYIQVQGPFLICPVPTAT